MTVANVPNGDIERMLPKVLIISENGSMSVDADKMAEVADVIYFQRSVEPDTVPYIFPDGERVKYATSWRPYVTEADMIIVDDPSFVAKLGKDFNLNGAIVLYRVNNESYEEAARLMHWLNPATVDALKAAMENADIEPEQAIEIKRPSWLRRLLRRSRA
jgi:hypothetical protein